MLLPDVSASRCLARAALADLACGASRPLLQVQSSQNKRLESPSLDKNAREETKKRIEALKRGKRRNRVD